MRNHGLTRLFPYRRFAALAMAIFAAGAAAAQAADTGWQQRAILALAASPGPDAKVTAAALSSRVAAERGRTLPLAERALSLAPDGSDLALYAVTACGLVPDCDAPGRETALRPLEPDNAAFHMAALHEASVRGDAAGVEATLGRMAKTSRFDVHLASLTRRFEAALRGLSLPRDPAADTMARERALGLWASYPLPPLQDLAKACRPDSGETKARRGSCRRIADALQHGDTMIANLIGLRLQAWNARDDADRAAAESHWRTASWRQHQMTQLGGDPAQAAKRQFDALLAHDRESAAVAAMLEAAGQSLEPPAGWQPVRPAGATPAEG